MAVYRLLVDHFVKNAFLPAGTIVSDTGPGAQLPPAWVPTPGTDPLDADATQKFWLAGPGSPGPFRTQFTGINIGVPTTWWKPVPGTASPTRMFQLTGLGSTLPPVLGYS
jgi:hypothetical protein